MATKVAAARGLRVGGSTWSPSLQSSGGNEALGRRGWRRNGVKGVRASEERENASSSSSTSSTSYYFVDKLVEDPVNALLVLGPRALAGALDALPKNVDELQQESQQVRDRLAMLAQDPRPWDVKSQLVIEEADSKLEELVQKGEQIVSDVSNVSNGFSSSSSSGTKPSSSTTKDGADASSEEEERSYQELSRKVAEFTNVYLLLQEVRKAKAKYDEAEEADEKMLLGIWNDAKQSLSYRLEELSEGLEEDFDLPFKELIEEVKACLD